MIYKNKKTGVTFSSSCLISGGDWVIVNKDQVLNDNQKEKIYAHIESEGDSDIQKIEIESGADKEAKTGDAAYDSITIPQIKQELDAFGIKYSATAKKQELYDLMMSQGK
ncbi:hypothetical protein DVW83_14865 [Enterococcus sp. VV15]|uniref:hypothetical protein n=1 Tax=Enterococcus sp. VV15 TaxID=2233541 RepID=UPI0010C1C318|nr:hypothetical protein [Enterococcus sp. VV15]TKN12277.1 hypothetical protein DVW83_14865 [Enterococcus sp. VV15]